MALIIKKADSDTLKINYDEMALQCRTYVLCRGKRLQFRLNEIMECGDDLKTQWVNDEFGIINQRWGKEATADEADHGFGFDIEMVPKANVEAIVIQEYGFIPSQEPYFMIPGSLYGTNNIKNSKSNQPQLNYRGDIKYPRTPVIRTRADRSTHNAVMTVVNDCIFGVRINECTCSGNIEYYNGLGIDTRNLDEKDRVEITFGYHHFPVRYIGKLGPEHSFTKEAEYGWIQFEKERTYATSGHIFLGSAENRFAYERVLKWFYERIHQHPSNSRSREHTVRSIAGALIKDAYDDKNKYFPTVLSGSFKDTAAAGDTAWTGGMQVVYPLIRSSVYVPGALETAADYLDNLLNNGINPQSGFLYESKNKDQWQVSGWWKQDLLLYNRRLEKIEEAHSAYVNGQATCYLLKSYRFAKDRGWKPASLESWLQVSKSIIDRVIESQRYDGALGVYFDPDNGEAIYYNSFQGAWFLAGIAELALITKEPKYVEAFNKANNFYYTFLEKVELWGMPMDTRDAVDEEGNLAYITALKTMHELTGEARLLEQLIHALHYEFSWKFAYNTKHVNEPLKSLNWASSGGSITSSHNIHIHQMGNLIAEEMYYVYKQSGDSYILSRLKDTLNWGMGTYNIDDGYFGFGKKGWATEQFFHSDGKQDDPNRIVDGGIWKDYLSWAAACVLLSSCADIPDELYIDQN
jgi:hypothetical protein